MKILLANKYYYPRGGDCIYTIELEKLLKRFGHDTAVFSMQHKLNLNSDFSEYFPSEIDYSKGILTNVSAITRPIYSREVKIKFKSLLNDFKPDLVHLNNIHTQLSPALAQAAYRKGIPVVWTLHDYKLLCPRYDCLRENKNCDLCFSRKINVVKYKCLKGSRKASLLAYLEALVWNKNKLSKYTGKFICPSEYIHKKMLNGGYAAEKLITLNNFINVQDLSSLPDNREKYYCYIGRLSYEKGLETLLKAASLIPEYHLKIVGSGPMSEYLISKYKYSNIEFCGHKNRHEVDDLLSNAVFMVIPSECNENNPLSVLESLSFGTPVLGANIGGIPELLNDKNGLFFESGNVKDLQEKIRYFWKTKRFELNYNLISDAARQKYSAQTYFNKLEVVYKSLIKS